jgi:Tfp pilus assembly protein FimT
MPELLIVILVIALISVLAFPRVTLWRSLAGFDEMQKQIVLSLNEARQEAIQQGIAITFRYDDADKTITTYGGNFGALNDVRNRLVNLSDFGLERNYIAYGSLNGTALSALSDSSSLAPLTDNSVEVIFQPNGSVIDEADAVRNQALFFYYKKYPKDAAFAVSVVGETGRVKVFDYVKNIRDYVEKR